MIDFVTLITFNIFLLLEMGLSFLILITTVVLRARTSHKAFLLVTIGEFLNIGWSFFWGFILQGPFLLVNLSEQGLGLDQISLILLFVACIDFFVSLIRTFLLLITLYLLAQNVGRRRYQFPSAEPTLNYPNRK